MKHASTRGAVRIAATPAAGARAARRVAASAVTLLALYAHAAGAQQKPVDIGFIGTLSTPAGYIGEDERDAFMLAVQEGGGKLGGCSVNVRVEDDALCRPTPSRAPTGWCRAACACSPA